MTQLNVHSPGEPDDDDTTSDDEVLFPDPRTMTEPPF